MQKTIRTLIFIMGCSTTLLASAESLVIPKIAEASVPHPQPAHIIESALSQRQLVTSSDTNIILGTLTLHDAVMLALRFNPSVINGEVDRVTQKYSLALAYHAFQPQLSPLTANANYGFTNAAGVASRTNGGDISSGGTLKSKWGTAYSVTANHPIGQYYNPKVSLDIKQPLLSGFGTDVNLAPLENAIDQEKINKLTLRDNVVNVINTITTDYRTLISDEELLDVQEKQLQQTIDQASQERLKIKAGKDAPSTLTQVLSQIAQFKVTLETQQNGLAQAQQQLLQDIGLDPDLKFKIEKNISVPNVKLPPLTRCIQLALAYSTSYQTTLLGRQQDKRALLVAEDAERWSLNLESTSYVGGGGSGGVNAGLNSLVNGYNRGHSLTVNLSVPLDKLQLHSAVVSAKIKLQEDEVNLRQARYLLETTIINSYRNLISGEKQIGLNIQSQQLAQQVLQAAMIKMAHGQSTQFEVNQNQLSLLTAENGVISAKISYLNSLTSFYTLLGFTLPQWHIAIKY